MKKLSILVFVMYCLSCKPSHSQKKINPEARKLNDSAVGSRFSVKYNNPNQALEHSINLLNQAIKLDSNYFTAYWNKFVFKGDLKQYNKAILTGKQMMGLRPQNASIKFIVGETYEKMGDTITSAEYYRSSLSMLNNILDTIKVSDNKNYKSTMVNKAIVLILLNQPEKGYSILKDLYNKENSENYKSTLQTFMNFTRRDFIYGKTTTTVTH
jgi:tetratricopeptide (TPR) repeat protein